MHIVNSNDIINCIVSTAPPPQAFYVGIGRSRSDALLFISSGSAVTSETRYLMADAPHQAPAIILPRQQDVEYDVEHHPGSGKDCPGWLLLTVREPSKPNSELRAAPVSDPTQQTVRAWTTTKSKPQQLNPAPLEATRLHDRMTALKQPNLL